MGSAGTGLVLKPGMCLALEPMVAMGSLRTRRHQDGWTVSTVTGDLSAHFEHTLVITDREPEILTSPTGSGPQP